MQQKWDLPGASMLVLKFFRFSRGLHTDLFLQRTSDTRIFDSKTRMEPSMTWLNKSSPLWVLPLAGSYWKVSKKRITCLHGPVALMENAACYAQTFCAKFSRFVWIWRVSSPHAWLNLGVTIYYKCFLTICPFAPVDLREARVSQLPEAEIPQAIAQRVGVTDSSSVATLVQGSWRGNPWQLLGETMRNPWTSLGHFLKK